MHYEGRHYVGLMRHLMLALVVLGFVADQTERLRGEKPGGDDGASVPGVEPAVRTLFRRRRAVPELQHTSAF